jgi:hypothetical protein
LRHQPARLGHPEFDAWRWHDYWVPLESVIDFKREAYRLGLEQLAEFLEVTPRNIGLSPTAAGASARAGLVPRPPTSGSPFRPSAARPSPARGGVMRS